MSLTQHLDDPASPVRRYLAKNFPHLRALRLAAGEPLPAQAPERARIPDTSPFPPPAVVPDLADGGGYPWGTAGTAFDYRLRYLYEATDPHTFVAASGAWRLTGASRRNAPAGADLWSQVAAALPRGAPGAPPGDLTPAQDADLTRLCVVLAWFEQVDRIGPSNVGADHPIAAAGPDATLQQVLDLVDDRVVTDLQAMTRLLIAEHRHLLAANRVTTNPTFACAEDLGGAEPDLLLGGLLLEVKTNKSVTLRATVVWQLLGYLLADTGDDHGIDTVGLYFARHGLLWTWPVPWFLSRLAGHEVDIARARVEFARACKPPPPQRVLPTATVETPRHLARYGPLARSGEQQLPRLPLYPPLSGKGLWHALATDARPHSSGFDDDAAACGNLRLDVGPHALRASEVRDHPTDRVCRLCFAYRRPPELPDPPGRLLFYPTADGGKRWHVPADGTGYYFVGDGDAPACSTPGRLDRSAEPVVLVTAQGGAPPAGNAEADARLCRRCLFALTGGLGEPRWL